MKNTSVKKLANESVKESTTGRGIYYRLITLWVLCEAMLGGIIHAAKIPVSGLIVGSGAVICICLIAYYVPAKGAIMKATLMVAVFKMVLSPQAPPMAYLAVFFQGVMGELLFWRQKLYRISCLLLGLIALVESGLQRIFVLTIIYGNSFWKAINDFLNQLTGQKEFTNYSLLAGVAYVVLHVFMGFVIGWWAGIIPQRVLKWKNQFAITAETSEEDNILPGKRKKKTWMKKGVFIIWIILILLYFQSYFALGDPIFPSSLPLQILIRSVIIVLAWYFVVSPLLSYLLKNWLQKKQLTAKKDIQQIATLLPHIQQAIVKSWKMSAAQKGMGRFILFSKMVLTRVLLYEE